jgi:hypothetical protein
LKDLDSLIEEILNLGVLHTNAKGETKIVFHNTNALRLDNLLPLLQKELSKQNELPAKLSSLRFSYNFPKLFSIFEKMKINDESSFEIFKLYLLEELNSIKQNNPCKKYNLYFLANIKNLKPMKFKYGSNNIEFLSLKKSNKILKRLPENKKYYFQKPSSDYSIIKIDCFARSDSFAKTESTNLLLFLLGLLLLIMYDGKDKRHFGGLVKPISELKLFYIFIFCENQFKNLFYFLDKTFVKSVSKSEFFDDNILEKFKSIKKHILKFDVRIKNYFEKSIQNYFEGVIQDDLEISYIKLWIAIEKLVSFNKRISYKLIKKRLKAIYKKDLDRSYVDRLVDLRHNYVHQGDSVNITQIDRNRLKSLCEDLFYFIYNSLCSKYTFEEIELALDNLNLDVDQLKSNLKVIRKIMKLKEKKNSIENEKDN